MGFYKPLTDYLTFGTSLIQCTPTWTALNALRFYPYFRHIRKITALKTDLTLENFKNNIDSDLVQVI